MRRAAAAASSRPWQGWLRWLRRRFTRAPLALASDGRAAYAAAAAHVKAALVPLADACCYWYRRASTGRHRCQPARQPAARLIRAAGRCIGRHVNLPCACLLHSLGADTAAPAVRQRHVACTPTVTRQRRRARGGMHAREHELYRRAPTPQDASTLVLNRQFSAHARASLLSLELPVKEVSGRSAQPSVPGLRQDRIPRSVRLPRRSSKAAACTVASGLNCAIGFCASEANGCCCFEYTCQHGVHAYPRQRLRHAQAAIAGRILAVARVNAARSTLSSVLAAYLLCCASLWRGRWARLCGRWSGAPRLASAAVRRMVGPVGHHCGLLHAARHAPGSRTPAHLAGHRPFDSPAKWASQWWTHGRGRACETVAASEL